MSKILKNTLWALVIAFLIFYLVTRPEQAGEAVKGLFGLFDSIGRFFSTIAK